MSCLLSPLIIQTANAGCQLSFLIERDGELQEQEAATIHASLLANELSEGWMTGGGPVVDLRSQEQDVTLEDIRNRISPYRTKRQENG